MFFFANVHFESAHFGKRVCVITFQILDFQTYYFCVLDLSFLASGVQLTHRSNKYQPKLSTSSNKLHYLSVTVVMNGDVRDGHSGISHSQHIWSLQPGQSHRVENGDIQRLVGSEDLHPSKLSWHHCRVHQDILGASGACILYLSGLVLHDLTCL